jgi:hypothetical protein
MGLIGGIGRKRLAGDHRGGVDFQSKAQFSAVVLQFGGEAFGGASAEEAFLCLLYGDTPADIVEEPDVSRRDRAGRGVRGCLRDRSNRGR